MAQGRSLFVAAGLMIAAMAGAGAQETLAAAKQAGLIGERPDGLAGVVTTGASPTVQSLVEQVNAQRLEHYRAIARSNDTPLDKIQALAGAQLIQRTPPGQYVQYGGSWIRK
jgi:hypothetical protein